MKAIYNPSMKEEPHDHPTWIIPPREEDTILRWLENAGRFIVQQGVEEDTIVVADHLVDEIIDAEAYHDDDDDNESEDED